VNIGTKATPPPVPVELAIIAPNIPIGKKYQNSLSTEKLYDVKKKERKRAPQVTVANRKQCY